MSRQSDHQAQVDVFQFSCVDPLAAKDSVLAQIKRYENLNTVVCPMNTKLSTIGVGFAAMEKDNIQIAYSEADEYNEMGYSTPGEFATIYEFPDKSNGSA